MRAVFLTLFIFFFTVSSQAQGFKIPDSLKEKSYEELMERLYDVYSDTVTSLIYCNAYLAKAKRLRENIYVAEGYSLIQYYQKEEQKKLKYLDSAINISKNLSDPIYPALPYSIKGGYYWNKWDLKRALDNYFLSLEYAEKNHSEYYIHTAKVNIAGIKGSLGRYDESIKGDKEYLKYSKENMESIGDTIQYITNLTILAMTYSKLGSIDSSKVYIKKGKEFLKFSKLSLNNYYSQNDLSKHLDFLEGVNHFYNNEYKYALLSIHKVLPFLKNEFLDYTPDANLYLAKIYSEMGVKDSVPFYYKKADSLYRLNEYLGLDLREAYSGLANYYKEKNDLKNQLVYVEKLLKFDSVFQENYKLMDKKLLDEYDIPNAVAQKEEIIAALEAEKSTNTTQIAVISLLLVLSLGGVGYYYRNQKVYKKRFLQLVDAKQASVEPIKQDPPKKDKTAATIGDETRDHLLAQLQQFEEKQGYLKSMLNAKDLAKSFGSNSSYLSIVVNTYKQKSFSQYINDLRIEYVVARLQTDTKFRKYTIKAIAQEIGFNTAEAFAKTFYKNTGIYPSYFIKQLEGRES